MSRTILGSHVYNSHDKYLDEIQMLEECARQLSDEVDALCEYVRHSRMLE